MWWSRAFAAASMAWAVALSLAPFAASRPSVGGVVFGFAYGMYAIGNLICHQIPERSFHLWATQMPVCARCTGIYLGAAIAAALFLAIRRRGAFHQPSAISHGTKGLSAPSASRIALVVAAIPTAATLLYEWTTGDTPANWIRALAGAPIGTAVAWIIREVD